MLVAAHDVSAGAVLDPADLRVVRRTASELPDGALDDASLAVGRTVGSGMRTGEALTDARLVGPGLLAGRPRGDVAAPVRIADGEAAALLRPGDRVDVLQASGGEGILSGSGSGSGKDLESGAENAAGSANGAAGENERDPSTTGGARTVVRRATVLARPGVAGSGGGLLPDADPTAGGLLVLAVREDEAADLAEAAARGPLAVVLR